MRRVHVPIAARLGRLLGKAAKTVRYHVKWVYVWLGETTGMTRYANCHMCKHCKRYGKFRPSIIGCDVLQGEEGIPDGFLAVTDPSEAVWCDEFEYVGHEEKWFERRDDAD